MRFNELSNEQRRQMVDAKQAFEAWREVEQEFRHSYRGSMHWRKAGGKQYLGRKYGNVWESLGVRSPDTEATKNAYSEQRAAMRQRRSRLKTRLDEMQKINRGYSLGRVPLTAAKVLRKLDEAGLLGQTLFVVGTHSLYAYEARAGIMFEGGLMATADIDLLWDTRRKLSLVVSQDVGREGLMGLLRNVDHSFKVGKAAPYRATNDEGYYVDLIRPLAANEGKAGDHRIGLADDDMTAAAILGLQWLINAPKFEDVAMGADGRPLLLSCVDPRAFALHKFWVSKQPDRNALSRRRDAEQAKAVAALAADYFGLKFNAKELSALPLELVREAKQLLAAAKGN